MGLSRVGTVQGWVAAVPCPVRARAHNPVRVFRSFVSAGMCTPDALPATSRPATPHLLEDGRTLSNYSFLIRFPQPRPFRPRRESRVQDEDVAAARR